MRQQVLTIAIVASTLTRLAGGQTCPPGKSIVQPLAIAAYFGIDADWERIQDAGHAVRIVVPDASFSGAYPQSDPGLAGTQLTTARNQFDALRAPPNNQLVLGYVETRGGNGDCTFRTDSEITTDVEKWLGTLTGSPDPNKGYYGHLDGFFLDDGPNLTCNDDAHNLAQYTHVFSLIRGMPYVSPSATIMLNAAKYPGEWVMSLANIVITWEQPAADYETQYHASNSTTPPCWWSASAYSGRIVNTITMAQESDLLGLWNLSQLRGSPLLNIVEGTGYGSLPSYFEEESTITLADYFNIQPDTQTITYCGATCAYTSMFGGPTTFNLSASASQTLDYYVTYNVTSPDSPSNMRLDIELRLDGVGVAWDSIPNGNQNIGSVPFHHHISVSPGSHALQLYFRSALISGPPGNWILKSGPSGGIGGSEWRLTEPPQAR